MIHYSCDRCKREIDSESDLRYIVRIEFEPAVSLDTPSDDADHLEALEAYLENSDAFHESALGEEFYSKKRYDLCKSCYQQFSKNPFASGNSIPLGFSKN